MISLTSGKTKLLLGLALLVLSVLSLPLGAWAAGVPDTHNSSVSNRTDPQIPIVGENFTFTAMVKDANNNTIGDLVTQDFTISGGEGTTTVTDSVYNAGAGYYTVTAFHDTVELFTMSVNARDVHIGSINVSVIAPEFAGGSGTEQDPYLIENADQLNNVRDHQDDPDDHFILVSDIDLSEYGDGAGWEPIGTDTESFRGNFNGDGYTISSLFIDRDTEDGVGLFGYTSGATIENVNLENVSVTGRHNVGGLVGVNGGAIADSFATGIVTGDVAVGGLVGYNYAGAIENSYATGSVEGNLEVGGLVGLNEGDGFAQGEITDSYAEGAVTGGDGVGGLVGIQSDGIITGSHATGTVNGGDSVGGLVGENGDSCITASHATGDVPGTGDKVGGLVGYNNGGTIEKSYATGDAGDETNPGDRVGGLVGENGGAITDSYATGSVTSDWVVGGLVGYNYAGTIENSYATGKVNGDFILPGGLVGARDHFAPGTITRSYYNSQTTGQEFGVGTGDNDGVTGLTSTEMVQRSAFNGWDFTDPDGFWSIVEWQSYPYLRWGTPDPLPAPPVVTGVTVEPFTLDLTYGGGSYDHLTATASPDAAVQAFIWSSSDESVATVDANGVVTVIGAGEATITATARSDGTKTGQATVTVNKKELTVGGTFTAESKVYDGNITATIDENSLTLEDVLPGDADGVTLNAAAAFDDANVGTGKTVSLTGDSLSGTKANNYTLALTGAPITTASITAKELTVGGTFTAENKVYDGNATATIEKNNLMLEGVIGNDEVTLNAVAAFTDADADADKIVSLTAASSLVGDDSGNYILSLTGAPTTTANITARATGGGGSSSNSGGGSTTPADYASKFIYAGTGGSANFGNATVEVPGGTLPDDATLKVERLTEEEAEDLIPSGLRVKIGSDVYDITTSGDRDFGDNTITIKISFDPDQIAAGEEPVIHYYDEETGEWTGLETIVEQDADGKWYAVVEVNHLTKFAVFSAKVEGEEAVTRAQKAIVLTPGQKTATVDGSPYTLDAAPYVDAAANRTLVPIRFVSEALEASVDWNAETRQVIIKDGEKEIILTIGSPDVLVNGEKQAIDSAPATLPPGRTFVPLRFVGENLGAQVDWDAATREITITR